MFGVNNQSARALAGPTTSSTAAINAHFFNIRSSWPSLHLSPWCDGVRGCGGASEVPTAPPQSSIEQLSPRQLCWSLVLSGLRTADLDVGSTPSRARPYAARAVPTRAACERLSLIHI